MGTNSRKRGNATHFRRRVPDDLKKLLKSSEIICSIGVLSTGDARRILAKLWLQTELLFMTLRANPDLDRDAIARVKAQALDAFRDHTDDLLDGVGALPTDHPLDEPANVAARMAGTAILLGNRLDRCAVESGIPTGIALGRDVLERDAVFDMKEQRRLGRTFYEGMREGAEAGSQLFAQHATLRPAPADFLTMREGPTVDETLLPSVLAALKVGDRVSPETLQALDPSDPSDCEPVIEVASNVILTVPPQFPPHSNWSPPHHGWALTQHHILFSKLWKEFSDFQVDGGIWKQNEALKSRFIEKMIVGLIGDKVISGYSAPDMRKFRRNYRQLPSSYAQAEPWRTIYANQGPQAVLIAAKTYQGKRISDKTWNRVYSTIKPLFEWAKSQHGAALHPFAPNPIDGLFVTIQGPKRTPAQIRDDWRLFSTDEIETIFGAPKFCGSASQSRWHIAGLLVFRDARYWLTLIAFLHGNRREEPVLLKVKHVKRCPKSGIWYFNWDAKELWSLLKDSGSPRDVPLHRDLLDLGFIEARVEGRDGEEPLFPDAGSDAEIKRDAAPYGQWFHRFLDSLGFGHLDRDVHAARHTVIVELESRDVTDPWIEAIVGHESKERRSSVDDYKHAKKLENLKQRVDLIDFPIDVERLREAVRRSDAIDPTAAWPDLKASRKWRRKADAMRDDR